VFRWAFKKKKKTIQPTNSNSLASIAEIQDVLVIR
jgi:hypothetical protein